MRTKYVLLLFCGTSLAGCSHFQQAQTKLSSALAEESRALTTAVVDVLQLQPPDERDRFSESALVFARQDQRVEGLPLKPFDAPALLGTETNVSPAKLEARQTQAHEAARRRFAFQDNLRAQQAAIEAKLIAFGATYEQERNAKVRAWTKWLGGGSLILGAAIALCVFFPVATPMVGRLLAWLVGKIPALAGAVGVVSTKALDAIVRGIEQSKSRGNKLGNDQAEESNVEGLHLNLSRSMDAAHKGLVRRRKLALKLG